MPRPASLAPLGMTGSLRSAVVLLGVMNVIGD
jgi:hypothetical protein